MHEFKCSHRWKACGPGREKENGRDESRGRERHKGIRRRVGTRCRPRRIPTRVMPSRPLHRPSSDVVIATRGSTDGGRLGTGITEAQPSPAKPTMLGRGSAKCLEEKKAVFVGSFRDSCIRQFSPPPALEARIWNHHPPTLDHRPKVRKINFLWRPRKLKMMMDWMTMGCQDYIQKPARAALHGREDAREIWIAFLKLPKESRIEYC